MSADGNRIICRKCRENISLDNSNCPNCGKSIRGTAPYALGIILGLLLAGAALFNYQDLLAYGIVGLLVAVTSGYFIYEKRQRMEEASTESQAFQG